MLGRLTLYCAESLLSFLFLSHLFTASFIGTSTTKSKEVEKNLIAAALPSPYEGKADPFCLFSDVAYFILTAPLRVRVAAPSCVSTVFTRKQIERFGDRERFSTRTGKVASQPSDAPPVARVVVLQLDLLTISITLASRAREGEPC